MPPWEHTGHRKHTSCLMLLNQKNSFLMHSNIKDNCLRTDRATCAINGSMLGFSSINEVIFDCKSSGKSPFSLSPRRTTSTEDERHRKITEQPPFGEIKNRAKLWYNLGSSVLWNSVVHHCKNSNTSRGNRLGGIWQDCN